MGKTVYLAGFDVFRPDAVAQGQSMKALCARYGLEGLYPLDHEAEGAQAIYEGNVSLIQRADAVIANLNRFRGEEPDSGTCFEVGYAAALGKVVYAYLEDGRTLRERLGAVDEQGYAVEDFGMPLNLMLGCAAHVVVGSFEDGVAALAAHFADDEKNQKN